MAELPHVNPRCEVIVNIDAVRSATEWISCAMPSTHWYPTQGGGTMALCHEHAQRHLPHGAWPIGEPATYEALPEKQSSPTKRELLARISVLESQLDAARKDRQALDWLDAHGEDYGFGGEPGRLWSVAGAAGTTIREALAALRGGADA